MSNICNIFATQVLLNFEVIISILDHALVYGLYLSIKGSSYCYWLLSTLSITVSFNSLDIPFTKPGSHQSLGFRLHITISMIGHISSKCKVQRVQVLGRFPSLNVMISRIKAPMRTIPKSCCRLAHILLFWIWGTCTFLFICQLKQFVSMWTYICTLIGINIITFVPWMYIMYAYLVIIGIVNVLFLKSHYSPGKKLNTLLHKVFGRNMIYF